MSFVHSFVWKSAGQCNSWVIHSPKLLFFKTIFKLNTIFNPISPQANWLSNQRVFSYQMRLFSSLRFCQDEAVSPAQLIVLKHGPIGNSDLTTDVDDGENHHATSTTRRLWNELRHVTKMGACWLSFKPDEVKFRMQQCQQWMLLNWKAKVSMPTVWLTRRQPLFWSKNILRLNCQLQCFFWTANNKIGNKMHLCFDCLSTVQLLFLSSCFVLFENCKFEPSNGRWMHCFCNEQKKQIANFAFQEFDRHANSLGIFFVNSAQKHMELPAGFWKRTKCQLSFLSGVSNSLEQPKLSSIHDWTETS